MPALIKEKAPSTLTKDGASVAAFHGRMGIVCPQAANHCIALLNPA